MKKEITVIKGNNTVSKHNMLIEKSYKLSPVELKLLSGIISLVNSLPGGDSKFRTYRININDIHKLFGYNTKGSLSNVKGAFRGLMSSGYDIVDIDKDAMENGEMFNWIEKTKYKYKDGDGYFDVTLGKHLQQFLLGLNGTFTKYKLNNILQLENAYSIRLYELLKGALTMGKKIIILSDIRKMLHLGNKYPLFGNFKARVLDVVIQEINEKTDIFIDYLSIKEGKKIIGVEFIIKSNNLNIEKDININMDNIKIDVSIENQLLNIGINPDKLDELILKYGRERLSTNYKLLKNEIEKGTLVKSQSGWFITSLDKNYKVKESIKQQTITDFYAEQNIINTNVEEIKLKKSKENFAKKKEFKEWFNFLSVEKQQELLERYKTGIPIKDKDMLIKARISTDFQKGLFN